jgi:threonine synthase
MKYVSTRGEAPELGFIDAMLAGLARDGGLYVPKRWPVLARKEMAALAGRPYGDVAKHVLAPFVASEIAPDRFGAMIEEAYATFRHPAVAPLVQIAPNLFALELFHGPTLAFKDVAMQLLARMMDHALAGRGRRATIVGATSGDTGGAAIEAFGGRDRTDIFILFPQGRVSEVQRRQMTTGGHANAHAIAVNGDFDDCQALVKALFNDHAFRDRTGLSGVNSINWARIMAQIVYYFTSALSLGAPAREVSFAVPTGNFGDIFAGYAAKRMGLPVSRLTIATNANDILARALASGRYSVAGVQATTSPSMDIQVSSNFERLLFEATGRDAASVRAMMASLAQSGGFTIAPAALAAIRAEFSAGSADDAQTAAMIRECLAASGYLADPHTAVGLRVAAQASGSAPVVALATAHPAKFPEAVRAACGVAPALPPHLGGLLTANERFATINNDVNALKSFIQSRLAG